MSDEMSEDPLLAPCARWAPLLAAGPRDLTAAERDALERHVKSCPTCTAVRAEYRQMDALIQRLPAPSPLPGLPPQLVREWEQMGVRRAPGAVMARRAREAVLRSIQVGGDTREDDEIGSERWFPVHSRSTSAQTQVAPRQHRFAGWIGAAIAAVVVLAFTLVFFALPRGHSGTPPTSPGSSSKTLAGNGWQAAYLAGDGHLHEVTLDGKHDTSGPLLPKTDFIRQTDFGWADTATSPDGHAIAYVTTSNLANGNGGDGIAIVTVATGDVTQVTVPATNLYWSPDGSQLAADAYEGNAEGPVYLVNPTTGNVTTVHATLNGQAAHVYRIAGWLDATHLAVLSARGTGSALAAVSNHQSALVSPLNERNGGPVLAVDVLDLGTGALRQLVEVTSPPDVFVSPDGKAIFVAPSTWVATGYVVDPATGQTRQLSHLSGVFDPKFVNIDNAGFGKGGNWASAMTWQPGTHIVAMSLGAWGLGVEGQSAPARQSAGIWLLDLDHDTATPVTQNTYPLAWIPGGNSLLMSDLPASNLLFGGLSVGPLLSLLSPVAPGGKVTPLSHQMTVFFGLVRAG